MAKLEHKYQNRFNRLLHELIQSIKGIVTAPAFDNPLIARKPCAKLFNLSR